MCFDLAQSSKRLELGGGGKGGKERGQSNFLTHLELVFSRLGRWAGV